MLLVVLVAIYAIGLGLRVLVEYVDFRLGEWADDRKIGRALSQIHDGEGLTANEVRRRFGRPEK